MKTLLCDRFNEDIKFMIGKKPCIFWQISLRFTSPLILLVILVFYLVTQAQQELTYLVWDPDYVSSQRPLLIKICEIWKKRKKKTINIISQNQLFFFYVILPHLMKKFHFYLLNIKNLQIFIVRQQDRFTGCFHGLKRGVDSYCKAAITPSTLLLGSKSSGSLALLVSSTELQAV